LTPQNQPSNPHHYAPVLTELHTRLHNTQSSLTGHFDNVRTLEGVIAEHNAIKREIGVLRELVEKETALAIMWIGGIARTKSSAVRLPRSTMSIQEVFGPSFRTSRRRG